MYQTQIDSDDSQAHLSHIIRMRKDSQFDQSQINGLARYINEHEKCLNNTIYLEELLLVIDGPATIRSFEQYCRTLYRIANRTTLDFEPALSFRASVNLELLRFWADMNGWRKHI